MSTANKLNAIINSKTAIKNAINSKGGNLTDSSKLSEYASAIEGLSTGGSGVGAASPCFANFNPYMNNIYNITGEIIYSTEGTNIPADYLSFEEAGVGLQVENFSAEAKVRPENICYAATGTHDKTFFMDGTNANSISEVVDEIIGIATLTQTNSFLASQDTFTNLKGLSLTVDNTVTSDLNFSNLSLPNLKMLYLYFSSGTISKTLSSITVDTLILNASDSSTVTLTIDSSCQIKRLIVPSNITVEGISASSGLEYYVPNGGSIPSGYGTLKYYWIPNAATQINAMAFMGCSNLYYVNVPSTVTSIAANSFMGVTTLKYVEMQSATPPTLALNGIPAGTTIIVPAGAKTAYEGAANWMNYTIQERA